MSTRTRSITSKGGAADYTRTRPRAALAPLTDDDILKRGLRRVGEWADTTVGNPGAGHWIYYLWSVQRLRLFDSVRHVTTLLEFG